MDYEQEILSVSDILAENPSLFFDETNEMSILDDLIKDITENVFEDRSFDENTEENKLDNYIGRLFDIDPKDKNLIDHYVLNFEMEIMSIGGMEDRPDFSWEDVYNKIISDFTTLFGKLGINLVLDSGNIKFKTIYNVYCNLIKDLLTNCKKVMAVVDKERNDKLNAIDVLLDDQFSIQDEFVQYMYKFDNEETVGELMDYIEDMDIGFEDAKFKDYLQLVLNKAIYG